MTKERIKKNKEMEERSKKEGKTLDNAVKVDGKNYRITIVRKLT